MKIAFLAGANSIHSIRWIKYFSDKGHKIIWISLAPPITEATELIKKVNFYEIKPSPLADINGKLAIFYLPLTVKKVRKILKNEKPDIFHVHSIGTYGLVGALSGFHPLILTAWGSDILLSRKLKKFWCDMRYGKEIIILATATMRKRGWLHSALTRKN